MKHPPVDILLVVATSALSAQDSPPRKDVCRAPGDVRVPQTVNLGREYALRLGSLRTVSLAERRRRRGGKPQGVVAPGPETTDGLRGQFILEAEAELPVKLSGAKKGRKLHCPTTQPCTEMKPEP